MLAHLWSLPTRSVRRTLTTATTETMSRLPPLVDDLPLKPTSLVRLLPQPRDLVNLAYLVQTMALLLLLLPLDAVNDADAPEKIGGRSPRGIAAAPH